MQGARRIHGLVRRRPVNPTAILHTTLGVFKARMCALPRRASATSMCLLGIDSQVSTDNTCHRIERRRARSGMCGDITCSCVCLTAAALVRAGRLLRRSALPAGASLVAPPRHQHQPHACAWQAIPHYAIECSRGGDVGRSSCGTTNSDVRADRDGGAPSREAPSLGDVMVGPPPHSTVLNMLNGAPVCRQCSR